VNSALLRSLDFQGEASADFRFGFSAWFYRRENRGRLHDRLMARQPFMSISPWLATDSLSSVRPPPAEVAL
jgi:hypothetical protein